MNSKNLITVEQSYDVIIIGKTTASLMLSLNLGYNGLKVLILDVPNSNKYPKYVLCPLKALDIMKIPYETTLNNFSTFGESIHSLERTFEVSRINFLLETDVINESEIVQVNSKIESPITNFMLFDKRELGCINIQKLNEYFIEFISKYPITIFECQSYLIHQPKAENIFKMSVNENYEISSKIGINTLSSQKKEDLEYFHKELFLSETLLTDGLDIFITTNEQMINFGYLFVYPAKNSTVINITGKKSSEKNLEDKISFILQKMYKISFEQLDKTNFSYEYSNFKPENPVFENNTFKCGSAYSVSNSLTFGYFSAELQTALSLATSISETLAKIGKISIEVIKHTYLGKLYDLSFITDLGILKGKNFYNFQINTVKELFKILQFTHMPYLSIWKKFKLQFFFLTSKNLKKTKKDFESIYDSYVLSRKWF